MPIVRIYKKRPDPIVAICISDIHLSLRPPIARALEPDWLKAMEWTFAQIKTLAYKNGCPIICAGDLFDRWNPPVELINWAIDHLPKMYAIPGNHDLPSHRLKGEHRSAYGTLVRAGKIVELGEVPVCVPMRHKTRRRAGELYQPVFVYGFPFGTIPVAPTDGNSLGLTIAVIHEYLWCDSHKYPGAKKKDRVKRNTQRFDGWDVVVVGDNHLGFTLKTKAGTTILNCGTLMRRKSSEADYEPQFGVIHMSGKVETRKLDISEDVLTELIQEEEDYEDWDFSEFIENLSSLHQTSLDFRAALIAAINEAEVQEEVRDAIMEALSE